VAISLVCSAEKPLLSEIEKLLEYAIPRQTIAEFPQVAVKRGVKAKVSKKSKGSSKPKKKSAQPTKAKPPSKPTKAKSPAKTTTSKRGKAATERPAPKTGRRGSRS